MLYIKIPDNWEYDPINYDFDALTSKDPVTNAILVVDFQKIVKEVLASWPKIERDDRLMKAPSVLKNFPKPLEGSITIYYITPKASESFSSKNRFLMYQPEKNGVGKSKNSRMLAPGDLPTKSSTTSYGIPWFKNPNLTQHMSKETLEQAQAKGQEKRANLRHDGDSPAVN